MPFAEVSPRSARSGRSTLEASLLSNESQPVQISLLSRQLEAERRTADAPRGSQFDPSDANWYYQVYPLTAPHSRQRSAVAADRGQWGQPDHCTGALKQIEGIHD